MSYGLQGLNGEAASVIVAGCDGDKSRQHQVGFRGERFGGRLGQVAEVATTTSRNPVVNAVLVIAAPFVALKEPERRLTFPDADLA